MQQKRSRKIHCFGVRISLFKKWIGEKKFGVVLENLLGLFFSSCIWQIYIPLSAKHFSDALDLRMNRRDKKSWYKILVKNGRLWTFSWNANYCAKNSNSNTVHLWNAYKHEALNMNTGEHKQMPRGCSQPVLKNKPSSKELSVPPSLRSFWRTWVIQ